MSDPLPTGSWFKSAFNRMFGFMSGSQPNATMDSPQAFRLVFVVSIIGVFLGGWLMVRTVTNATKPLKAINNGAVKSATQELALLKNKDTDGDGLSDYDELFTYNSSPYLFSSAGDGISDSEKVRRGLDPSCPVNKNCTPFTPVTYPIDSSGQLTPAFLRQSLQKAGVAKSVLDQLDDASLLGVYNQVLSQQFSNSNVEVNSGSTVNTNEATNTSITLDTLQNLTDDQIRQLLIQSGVSQSELSQLDNATLRQIYTKALQDQSTNTNQ